MITEYIQAALRRARYEIIEDDEPYYGEIEGLQGVWASGGSLEQCRERLAETLDGWILVRLSRGLAIPALDGVEIWVPRELNVA